MKLAYYNEYDPFAAAWLRELIKDNLIAPGDVDERSIEDVKPSDLDGYTQCHFFAGIGVWSLALREAGWGDDRPIWTGSCPCQPFSAAGKGGGFADERHLWPAFHHLIRECSPEKVVGEQVASKDGLTWLDLVQTDLEGEGYAFGAVDTCAAGFGAPHIRQRLYWAGVGQADASGARLEGGQWVAGVSCRESETISREAIERSGLHSTVGLAYSDGGNAGAEGLQRSGQHGQQPQDGGTVGGMAYANCEDSRRGRIQRPGEGACQGSWASCERPSGFRKDNIPGPTNGLWRTTDWLGCRDGKWRPVEPGTFPLAHARTFCNRVAELRGAGNALNVAQAASFIEAAFGTNGKGSIA